MFKAMGSTCSLKGNRRNVRNDDLGCITEACGGEMNTTLIISARTAVPADAGSVTSVAGDQAVFKVESGVLPVQV